MNHKKRVVAALTLAAMLTGLAFGLQSNPITANAATISERVFFDNFDADEINTSRWTVGADSATLKKQAQLLRLNLDDSWGHSVTLQSYKVTQDCKISFELTGTGSYDWLGLALGSKESGKFMDYAQNLLLLKCDSVSLMDNDKALGWTDSSVADNTIPSAEIMNMSQGENTCLIQIVLDKRDDGKYNIAVYAGKDEFTLNKIAGYGGTGEKKSGGIDAEGLISLCGRNFTGDILSFKIEDENGVAYTAAFNNGDLAFPSEGREGKDWAVSSYYDEKNLYCGVINRLVLGRGASLISNSSIASNEGIEKTFDLSYKMYIEQGRWAERSFIGVIFGCESENEFVGFGKKDGKALLVHYKQGEILSSETLPNGALKDGENTVSFGGRYGDKLEILLNGKSYVLKSVTTEGKFAFGCINIGNDEEITTAEIDDVEFISHSYNLSTAESKTNDFTGIKTTIEHFPDGDMEMKEYYVNRSAYYVGNDVSLPMFNQATYPNSAGLIFSDCTTQGYFAPRQTYGEWILRFDLKVMDERKVVVGEDGETIYPEKIKPWALIGVSFGKEYVAQSATETDGIYFMNWYNPSFTGQEGELFCGTYCAEVDPDENGYIYGEQPISYDLWSTKDAVYNIMVVAENSTVKLYMKRSDEPEEKMLTPIVTLTDVNTYGYVAITGLEKASFMVMNYSLVNMSPYRGGER